MAPAWGHSSAEPVNALASALAPALRFPVVMPVFNDQEPMCDSGDLHARNEADARNDCPVRHAMGKQRKHQQHDAFQAKPCVARVQAVTLKQLS